MLENLRVRGIRLQQLLNIPSFECLKLPLHDCSRIQLGRLHVFSHLQTKPSSGSITSPTRLNPHLVSTRLEALASGSVWARTIRTFPLAIAYCVKAAAASVA